MIDHCEKFILIMYNDQSVKTFFECPIATLGLDPAAYLMGTA